MSNDHSINVCKFDKGNGIQIFYSTYYFNKHSKLTLNKSKFSEILQNNRKVHPIDSKENVKQNLKHHLPDRVFKYIAYWNSTR